MLELVGAHLHQHADTDETLVAARERVQAGCVDERCFAVVQQRREAEEELGRHAGFIRRSVHRE